MLFIGSEDILKVAPRKASYILNKESYMLNVILMLIGLAHWMIDAQLQDIVFLLEVI
jgi:hypothetical protein